MIKSAAVTKNFSVAVGFFLRFDEQHFFSLSLEEWFTSVSAEIFVPSRGLFFSAVTPLSVYWVTTGGGNFSATISCECVCVVKIALTFLWV